MAYSAGRTPFGFAVTPWVKRLLIANTVVFFITLIDRRFFLEWFAFTPTDVVTRPWGAVTYMFLHGDLWHLFINMLVLFFFGPPLEARWGSREFIKFYLICGMGGVALSFLFVNASIIGASAAVYGVMLAFALNWPESPIYIWGIFPIKAKWLVGFLFVVSLMSAFGGGGGSGIAHFAHLGGIMTGFLYLKGDFRASEKLDRFRKARRSRRFAIVPREEGAQQASGSDATNRRRAEERRLLDEVDRVLDKISAQGMGSLTAEERKLLDEVSRRHQSN